MRSLVAWLISGASALACRPELEHRPETVTAALSPARPVPSRAGAAPAPPPEAPRSSSATPPVNAAVEAVLPSEIAGTWEVVEVLVNWQDGVHRLYRRGDARLMGRTLTIEEGRVRFSFGADLDCRQVRWPRRALTWGTLNEQAFRRPPSGGRRASLADFGLTVKRKQAVTVHALCPPAGSPAPLDEGQWVVELRPGELLFREDPQYLLRLTRRPEDTLPAPASFTCTRPRTPTQRTICQSHDLASWDRSVTRALDDFVKARPQREAEVKLSQAAYVQRRDSCGADADCIEQEQMTRVGELIQMRAQ
jgi:hypothetical protein